MVGPITEVQQLVAFEQLNITRYYEFEAANIKERDWGPTLFLRAGYNLGSVVTPLRFELLYDKNKSFYSSPWMPIISMYF